MSLSTTPPLDKVLTSQTMPLSTGGELGFAEYGDPKGKPFIYYHGWPSSRLQGELMHSIGLERGLRFIAPDRPGIGLSTEQPGRSLLDWPPVLAELLAHLGVDRFHVMGISGGGPYVLATVHAMPERLCAAGVLCGAPPLRIVGTSDLLWTYKLALFAKTWLPWTLPPGLAAAAWCMRRRGDQWPMNNFVQSLCPRDQEALRDPERYRVIAESCLECLRSPTSAVRTDGDIYASDWGFDLGQLQLPIQIWHGEADKNIPFASAQKMAALIPKARTKWFKEDGHYSLPLLRADEMVEAMLAEGQV